MTKTRRAGPPTPGDPAPFASHSESYRPGASPASVADAETAVAEAARQLEGARLVFVALMADRGVDESDLDVLAARLDVDELEVALGRAHLALRRLAAGRS